MCVTVAMTVLPVGLLASSTDRQKWLCYWQHTVPGTQALSDHCRQAVATACLVALGPLQEPRRHVCLPPAPGVDWAQQRCGQVTDFLKEKTLEVSFFYSELAKASQLFSEIKVHRTSFLLLVNSLLSMFSQDCVWVRQIWIIFPKIPSHSNDLSVPAKPAQKEELKIWA
jgi:hypothetical protein